MSEWGGYASAGAAILVAVAGALVRWLVKWVQTSIKTAVDGSRQELSERISTERDTAINRFGETVQAIRQKINDMELWNRDNFVNRRTFDGIMADTRESLKRLEDKLDARFDRIDQKLSTIRGDE